jgi:hypothetical protein
MVSIINCWSIGVSKDLIAILQVCSPSGNFFPEFLVGYVATFLMSSTLAWFLQENRTLWL